jgi:hypothetical protein
MAASPPVVMCFRCMVGLFYREVRSKHVLLLPQFKLSLLLLALLLRKPLGFGVWKVKLHCDSTGCIANLKNPVNSKYTKHIVIAFHHAREDVVNGNIDLKYIPSAGNVADIFTKALPVPTFLRLKNLIPVA